MAPKWKDKRNKTTQKGKTKRVAGFDEIKARNNGEDRFAKRDAEEASDSEEEESSSEEEEEQDPKVFKKAKPTNMMMAAMGNLNIEEEEAPAGAPVELTRRQREEIEAEQKKRHYEKLQKEGKTDQAKADMERLQKIRADREAAKVEREAEQKKKEAEAAASTKNVNTKEVLNFLGGDDARLKGTRSKKEKKEKTEADKKQLADSIAEKRKADAELYATFGTGKIEEKKEGTIEKKGTIEACKEEEDDFM